MITQLFVLSGRIAVPCSSVEEWGVWMGDIKNKRVDKTDVGCYSVSTVFLGIDHNFSDCGDPLLFETMVFDKDWNSLYCERCSTWAEAEVHHKIGIEYAKILAAGV